MNNTHKIYKINVSRNKRRNGVSLQTMKKDLVKIYGNICNECSKDMKTYNLHLEHTIPIAVGGKIWDKENHTLMCNRCHLNKTILDKRIIHIMKKIGIIKGKCTHIITSFTSPSELSKLYSHLKILVTRFDEMKLLLDNKGVLNFIEIDEGDRK